MVMMMRYVKANGTIVHIRCRRVDAKLSPMLVTMDGGARVGNTFIEPCAFGPGTKASNDALHFGTWQDLGNKWTAMQRCLVWDGDPSTTTLHSPVGLFQW
jgi:hypothetical protein